MSVDSLKQLLYLSFFSLVITCISTTSSLASPIIEPVRTQILDNIATLPVPFVENRDAVSGTPNGYTAYTFGGTMFVNSDGSLTYALIKPGGGWALCERIASCTSVSLTPSGQLGEISSFLGNDLAGRQARLSYGSVGLGEICRGVNLFVNAYGDRIEKQFRLAPGVPVSTISVQTTGADSLGLSGSGDLVISSSARGTIRMSKPVAYQVVNGIRTVIDCAYTITGATYSFVVGNYDDTGELVITVPLLLEPATGYANGNPLTAAIDANINVFLAGSSVLISAPLATGPFDISAISSKALFVARYNSTLDGYPTVTLLGGTGADSAAALDVAADGSLFVAGSTTSVDFPVTPGALSTVNHGAGDVFIAKFDAGLHTLQASTYLGGTDCDEGKTLSFGEDGSVVVSGTTTSYDFPGIVSFPHLGLSASFTFTTAIDNNLTCLLTSSVVVTPAADTPSDTTSTNDTSGSTTTTSATTTTTSTTTTAANIFDPHSGKPAGPGWCIATARPVSPDQARASVSSLQNTSRRGALFSAQGPVLTSSTTLTNEIYELARGLRYNPKLIYDYVHNNIDYVPYYGSTKGATLTYLDGSGNDFDQASLMIALLRASGYTAQYVYGTMTIPLEQMADWLGVAQNSDVVSNVLGNGGIPVTNGNMYRVWVKMTDENSTDHYFDPAFKTYAVTSKIDLAAAMNNYTPTGFLAGAANGATIVNPNNASEPKYVQNLNEENIKSNLTAYSNSLVTTINSQYPNKSVEDIVGGRSIVQSYLTEYPTSLPFSPTVTDTWDDVPAEYATTIHIEITNTFTNPPTPSIDYAANTSDLGGKRLTLTYTGADNHPILSLDGTVVASGIPSTLYTRGEKFKITIDHPYTGTYCDQYTEYWPLSGSKYAVVYNFGGVSDTLLQKHQQKLEGYKAWNYSDGSEPVLGETLHIMGMTWLKEVMQSDKLLCSFAGDIPVIHHNVGLMCQESWYQYSWYYIDVRGGMSSFTSCSDGIMGYDSNAFKVHSLILSALEHGMLEQLCGSDKPAASTMKLFQIANANHEKVFLVNHDNYAGTLSQLTSNTYSTVDLNDFQGYVNNNNVLILPANGLLTLNRWKGNGYIRRHFTSGGYLDSMWMMIGGNYYGGHSSNLEGIYSWVVSAYSRLTGGANSNTDNTNSSLSNNSTPDKTTDPVEMAGGSFLVDHTDLALGGVAPLGLAFSRSYTSSERLSKRNMGNGWTHNYDIYLTPVSHGEPGLGLRRPVDAAAMIAALYVDYDLLNNHDDLTAWMSASLVSKWAIDQVIDNAIVVHLGNKVIEFVRLSNGSFAPPPGITTQLVKIATDTYRLEERTGGRINFNPVATITNSDGHQYKQAQASSIEDVERNTLTFTYSGNYLTRVTDKFSRTIDLAYDSATRVHTVTDSTGRSVQYDYDANNDLTAYHDAEGKIWQYGYTDHRMTTLINPLGITTAANEYDSNGRVMTQTVPRQSPPGMTTPTTATYNLYFSGFRNVEEDSSGNTTTYYFDHKGREFMVEDALGRRNSRLFDGQNNIVQSMDALNNITSYIYDGNNNLTQVTDPFNNTTVNTYAETTPFLLAQTADPLNHTSFYTYNAHNQLTGVQNGAGDLNYASYYSNGFKDTSVDGRGTRSEFTHDDYGNPKTATTASHPAITYGYDALGRMTSLTDQLGSTTRFAYDNLGKLLFKSDPLGHLTGLTYYDDGSLYRTYDRNGAATTYYYTPSGKPDHFDYSDGTVGFLYNLLDQATVMQDSIGLTHYTYDSAGRLASQTNPNGMAVSYDYDEAGNLKTLTYPGNKQVKYTYDALNRMETVTIDWLSAKPSAGYDYDEAGRMTEFTNFNGIATGYGYDDANRLTLISSPVTDMPSPWTATATGSMKHALNR